MIRLYLLLLLLLLAVTSVNAQPLIFFRFDTYDEPNGGEPIPIMHGTTAVPIGRLVQVIKPNTNMALEAPQTGSTTAGRPGTGNTLSSSFAIGTGTNAGGTFDVFLISTPTIITPGQIPIGSTFWARVWWNVNLDTVFGTAAFGGASYCDCGPFAAPTATADPYGNGPEVICTANPNSANPTWYTLPGGNGSVFTIRIGGNANPALYNFDSVRIGSTARVPVMISNPDTTMLALLSRFIPAGGAFSWSHALPSTITAGSSVNDTLIFTPTMGGTVSDTLHIISNARGSPYNCVLSGTGTPITRVPDAYRSLPTQFSIEPAYPNPFNSSVSFEVGIPHNTDVRLLVFNMLGQQIATLHSGSMTAGYHRFEWNAVGSASGSYFVKMEAPGVVKTQMIRYVR